jgi:hypothetical protein
MDGLPQGCQIFLGTTYQNGENIPNYYKIHQMSIRWVLLILQILPWLTR